MAMPDFISEIRTQLRESARVKESFSEELLARISRFAETAAAAIRKGNKIVFFGNGGSAADAQHLAAELVVRLQCNRASLPALALTTNTSILTAAANDLGFDSIFSRQIESLVSQGDILVAISTSGASSNILRGAEAGRARRALIVGMTSETGGELASRVDLLINVPSRDSQRIQEAHITIGHIVCALIERICCGNPGT
jgi:D-sedoheptulose 7-phosphate isomerase